MSEIQTSSPTQIPLKENTKVAMWVFLGGEVVFFVSLILLITFNSFNTNRLRNAVSFTFEHSNNRIKYFHSGYK